MGGEHGINFQVLADNILHEDVTVRLASVRKLKHLIIGNKKHKYDLVHMGVVPRLVRLLAEQELHQELLCEVITALGSFAHGTRSSIEAVISAEAVPSLSRGLLHSSPQVVLCCLRTLSTLYSCNLYTLDSDLIFYNPQIVSRLVSLLVEPHPLGQRAAILLAKTCQTRDHQTLLCEYQALQKLVGNLRSPVNKMVAASLHCMSSIVFDNPVTADLLASLESQGEPLVCVLLKILSTSRDSNSKMAAAKCLSFLHRCRGIEVPYSTESFPSDVVAMDTSQSGKGSSIPSQSAYGIDNFQSGISLKVLPTLARFTRKDMEIQLRTEAISTLAYLTEQELSLQELAADSEKLIPCVASYLTALPPDPECEVVLPDHSLLWRRLKGACLLLLASLASFREELRCKVGGQRGVVEHLAKALEDENGEVRVAALRCLLSLSRSTKLLRTTLYDHSCWKHVVDMLSHDPSGCHTHIRACLRGASAVACNFLLPFSPCREVMIEVGVVSKLVALTDHDDEVIKVNSIWALMSTADSSSADIRLQVVNLLTFDRVMRFLSPSSSSVLLRKSLGLLVNLTQGHERSSDIGEKLLTQEEGGDILSAVGDLMEGAWQDGQVEQCLCLLVNLSGCGSRAKDMLTGQERLIKILCNILRTSDHVSVVMAVVDIVRNLSAVECDGHVHRQNCLKEFGANTALQKLEIKFEHKRLQLHIQDALEQFSA